MSTIKANTLQNVAASKSAPVGDVVDGYAKAWVNFNGTGTPAIRAAFNVSSITDNGPGTYTINLTNPMPDVNFGAVFSVGGTAGVIGGRLQDDAVPRTTSTVRVVIVDTTFTPVDAAQVAVAIFR